MSRNAKSAPRGLAARVASAVVTLIVAAGAVLAVLLVAVPRFLDGLALTVLTGSMEPGIHPGDVVVTSGINESNISELKVGDVITFLPYPDDPTLVTHRIVAVSAGANGTAYVTKGDNNNSNDPWGAMTATQIRGKVVYVVPYVGFARQWAGDNAGWVVTAVGVLLIGYGLVLVLSSRRRDEDDPDATDLPPRRAAELVG